MPNLWKFRRVGTMSTKPVSSLCYCTTHIQYMASTVPRPLFYRGRGASCNTIENHLGPCSASSSVPARPSSHVAGRRDMSGQKHIAARAHDHTFYSKITRSPPLPVPCRKAQPLISWLSHIVYHSVLPPRQTKIRRRGARRTCRTLSSPPHHSLTDVPLASLVVSGTVGSIRAEGRSPDARRRRSWHSASGSRARIIGRLIGGAGSHQPRVQDRCRRQEIKKTTPPLSAASTSFSQPPDAP